MIPTDELEKMAIELLTGKEPTLHGPEADAVRAKLRTEIEAIQASGLDVEVPHEIADPA